MAPAVRLSFCTSCFNRSQQLKQTFQANADMVAKNPDVEWVIYNFGSEDDLHEFMTSRLPSVSSRIRYAHDRIRRAWHLSVAKNFAHRLGQGEILMNLDCDNFIGGAIIAAVAKAFGGGYRALHHWSGNRGDGTCGRVALTNKTFHALGGYDESFRPMGYQDYDLLARARASGLGLPLFWQRCAPGLAIPNTKEESVRYCSRQGLGWSDFEAMNRAQSAANIAAGRYVANVERAWSPLVAEMHHGARAD